MDLQQFKVKAARRRKSLSAFLDKLDDIVPEDMPEIVARADKAMWQEVSCVECANCCKTMTPTFTKADVKRISAHFEMKPKEFMDKWLLKEEGTGDWINKVQPCQFLDGNLCAIYEVRPADCAEFPHHNKKPFDSYNETFKNNLVHCPATLSLVSKIKNVVETEYEW